MSLNRIASYVFLASLLGILVIYTFLSGLWIMGWPILLLLGLAAVSLLAWAVFSLGALQLWLKKRSTQFAIGLAMTALSAVAILTLINYEAVQYNVKKDFTVNQLHTLSDQTKKIVGNLKENVSIRVWSTNVERMSPNLDMRKFFENYKIASGGKLKVELLNPNEDRLGANKDAIKKDNVVIIRSASGREVRVDNFTDTKGEEQITNGITQAIKGHKKTICFLSGHGELGLDDAQAQGLSFLKQRLTDSAYDAKDVPLAGMEKLPADCETVAIVGPQRDALERESKMIEDYLHGGGKVIALLGPGTPPTWKKLVAGFGVEVRADLIVDPKVRPPIAVATKNFAQDVDIVKAFNLMVLFPEVASLKVPTVSPDPKMTIKTFVSSESYTYAKAGELKAIKGLNPGPNDLHGPLPIAVLVTKPIEAPAASPEKTDKVAPPPPAKHSFNWIPEAVAQEFPPGMSPMGDAKKDADQMALIVVANSIFVSNSVVNQMGNMDLFLNSVNYLVKDQDLIGIRPREIRQASLELSPERERMVKGIFLIIAFLFMWFGIRASHRRSAGA